MTTPRNRSPIDGEIQLTPCEFQVCYELVNTALVHKQIAAKLGKSAKTVEVQIASAYKKLGVTSRWELIHRFNSEREIPVKSLPPTGLVNRMMQLLDEIERVLNDLLIKERRLPSTIRRIESITSVDDSLGPRYAAANVGTADSKSRRRICSEFHRVSAAPRTGTDQQQTMKGTGLSER
jgi:DNA-binding CsgD family transcriptional regulator